MWLQIFPDKNTRRDQEVSRMKCKVCGRYWPNRHERQLCESRKGDCIDYVFWKCEE